MELGGRAEGNTVVTSSSLAKYCHFRADTLPLLRTQALSKSLDNFVAPIGEKIETISQADPEVFNILKSTSIWKFSISDL